MRSMSLKSDSWAIGLKQQAIVSVTKSMTKQILVWLLVIFFVANVSITQAQQAKGIPRLGYLTASSRAAASARIQAFQQGLRELGYVEGKSISIEWRFADGKLERMPELASELVRLNVDIIVTGGAQATRPAKHATATIPIVMAQDNDPIANGFIASLANPGGNITGLSTLSSDLTGKRMEILKETIPKLKLVAINLITTRDPGRDDALKRETEALAKALSLHALMFQLRDAKDADNAFGSAKDKRADAFLAEASAIFGEERSKVAELAIKYRLPVMYARHEFVDAGGLMSYAPSLTDMDRRAATYVDKILKGRTPADLPVEQPIKFEFIVNLKAAKQIGLTIPPNVLARADRVIR